MAYIPNRGDIIHLNFDPASGHEMKGEHYGLVLSLKAFNVSGLVMVCPISQGAAAAARTHGMVVTLIGSGTDTQGAVHCHQLKSLDWKARRATLKESVPESITDEALARIQAIFE